MNKYTYIYTYMYVYVYIYMYVFFSNKFSPMKCFSISPTLLIVQCEDDLVEKRSDGELSKLQGRDDHNFKMKTPEGVESLM